ncbi:hypothetical protein [Antrihabitans sp. YC2-6]|uniref:hypothetical protein n=1 Tax=Antrihabitans sp. YC2-6 TaxID=2799498 RepID=UPI0018F6BDED|nr:hypothetical protein [Antrihabitans sp. YC2-6]MBJ8343945.1 hypothetical protein [Antrihabitans sp. YC2-6]
MADDPNDNPFLASFERALETTPLDRLLQGVQVSSIQSESYDLTIQDIDGLLDIVAANEPDDGNFFSHVVTRLSTNLRTQITIKITDARSGPRHSSSRTIVVPFGALIRENDLVALRSMIRSFLDGNTIYEGKPATPMDFANMVVRWESRAYRGVLDELSSKSGVPNLEIDLPERIKGLMSDRYLSHITEITRIVRKQADDVVVASGQVSAGTLSGAFAENAKYEGQRAIGWSIAVLGSVVIGILIVVKVVGDMNGENGWISELVKLAIALPVFAFATYCARIASKHRETAQHVRLVSVQLQTVNAYCNTLPDEQAMEIRMQLGRRVFDKPDILSSETASDASLSMIPKDLFATVNKMIDTVREVAAKKADPPAP